MTRRLFIYVDNKERKLYVSPSSMATSRNMPSGAALSIPATWPRRTYSASLRSKPSPTFRKPALRHSNASIPPWIGLIPLKNSFQLRR